MDVIAQLFVSVVKEIKNMLIKILVKPLCVQGKLVFFRIFVSNYRIIGRKEI